MSTVLVIVAIIVIWIIWGLNKGNKVAERIVQRGGMHQIYSTLISACSIGNTQIINEARDMISLKTESRNSIMFMTIAQNADYVSIDVIVTNSAIGKVHKLFSFPETMDQHQMVRTINETMSEMINKKINY